MPPLIIFSDGEEDSQFEMVTGLMEKEKKAADPLISSDPDAIDCSSKTITNNAEDLEFLASFFDANCNMAAIQSNHQTLQKMVDCDDKNKEAAAAILPTPIQAHNNLKGVHKKTKGDIPPKTIKLNSPPKIRKRRPKVSVDLFFSVNLTSNYISNYKILIMLLYVLFLFSDHHGEIDREEGDTVNSQKRPPKWQT